MSRKKERMGEPFHIRLPEEIETRVEQIAQERYMSMTDMLRCLISEGLDQVQKSPTGSTKIH